MLNNKAINYVDNSLSKYDFNHQNFDKSFDYKTLVNGSHKLENGDYIYIPSISLKKSKIFPKFYLNTQSSNTNEENKKYVLDRDALSFSTNIEIYSAITNTFVASIEKEYFIPMNIDSNFTMIELFTKKDKEFLNDKLIDISNSLYNEIVTQLSCKPITAKIQVVNDRLSVPLGYNQGLRVNQLAVLEDNSSNNITMLSISELSNSNAILSPLNSNIELVKFSGKQTRFLE